MDIEVKLRHEMMALDPGPTFTAGVMARVKGHWRPGGRFILFGAILIAGAAAAAMLHTTLTERFADTSLKNATEPTLETAYASMPAVQGDMNQSSRVAPVASHAPEEPASAARSFNSFIVSVSELRHESKDPASIAAAQSFYRAFVLELQKIPEIVVVEPGAGAQYRIAVTARPSPDTPALYIEGYNKAGGGSIRPGSSRWQVQVAVESPRLEYGIYITESTGFFPSDCSISPAALRAQMPNSTVCPGPADVAWSAVQTVRRRVFPGATRPPQMTAEFDAEMLERATRNEASLQKSALIRKGRDNWQSADIAALADLAGAEKDPVRRLNVWNSLRGARNPAAASHIITVLQADSDARVRLGALQMLQQDYAGDPAVAAAIESTARNDPQVTLRQLARNFLSGGASWHNSVSASLRDTSLSDHLRLEQLLLIASSSELAAALPAIVDSNAAAALGDLLPRMSADGSRAADAARILKLFSGSDFLRMKLMANALRDPDPAAQATALGMVKIVSDDNPGLRTAFERNSAANPEMQVLLARLRAVEAAQSLASPPVR